MADINVSAINKFNGQNYFPMEISDELCSKSHQVVVNSNSTKPVNDTAKLEILIRDNVVNDNINNGIFSSHTH